MRCLVGFLALLPLAHAQSEGWPGLPPDCWSQPRLVHGDTDFDPWRSNVAITQTRGPKPPAGAYSPNGGYYFALEGDGRPDAKVTIYAEKEHLVVITLANLHGLSEVKWVNEKLLFLRPWWGRIVGTDILFDVEREQVIYAETLTDGSLAYRQYRESCPLHGCECIPKE